MEDEEERSQDSEAEERKGQEGGRDSMEDEEERSQDSEERKGQEDGRDSTEKKGQEDGQDSLEKKGQEDGQDSLEKKGQEDGQDSFEKKGQEDGQDSLENKGQEEIGQNLTSSTELSRSSSGPVTFLDKPAVIVPPDTFSPRLDIFRTRGPDPYSEDEAERLFLQTKPACFMIFGKPGVGKTTLAELLADQMHCCLVSAEVLISGNIEGKTLLGEECADILNRGELVTEEMLLRMMKLKMKSEEVPHHGYVLDIIPSFLESTLSVEDQLQMVKGFLLTPDFIIHLKISDADLLARTHGLKIDPETGIVYTKEQYAPTKPLRPKQAEKDTESLENDYTFEEEDEFSEESRSSEDMFEGLPEEVVKRLVTREEDLSPAVEDRLAHYNTKVQPIVDKFIASHDRNHVIELDGNRHHSELIKQLMRGLKSFPIHPAVLVQQLREPTEEDDEDEHFDNFSLQNMQSTEDLMRSLAAILMIAPRHRWRRSRWLRYCPVALYDGDKILGKAEYAVSFLDKIYCLSSQSAMELFINNPRPYLLHPQPRPPCKLSVLGPPKSGKSTLCRLLAHKYEAKIFDVEELTLPRLRKERAAHLKQKKEESTTKAIEQVITRIKDEALRLEEERAAAALAAAEAEALELEKAVADLGDRPLGPVIEESSSTGKASGSGQLEELLTTQQIQAEQTAEEPPEETVNPEDKVNANHPEVVAIVGEAMKVAEAEPFKLGPEIVVELIQSAISSLEKERNEKHPECPHHGGWVLDNFPCTLDMWMECAAQEFFPDTIILLTDDSTDGLFLASRVYSLNKKEVNRNRKMRQDQEELEAQRKAEEERKAKEEEMKELEKNASETAVTETEDQNVEMTEPAQALEPTEEGSAIAGAAESLAPSSEAGETVAPQADEAPDPVNAEDVANDTIPQTPGEGEEGQEQEQEQEQQGQAASEQEQTEETQSTEATDPGEEESAETAEGETGSEKAPEVEPEEEIIQIDDLEESQILDCPEMAPFLTKRAEYEKETGRVLDVSMDFDNVQKLHINVADKTFDQLFEEVVLELEKPFVIQGWEYSLFDIDEEEEDKEKEMAAMLEEELEEEAEEEAEDDAYGRKKAFGDTSIFCPVALKETRVLFPGAEDWGARYRERLYYCSSVEAREKFLVDPTQYLPLDKPPTPPPIRFLILGNRGSGKTLHGKHLAEKLGIYHIAFREKLQEIFFSQTKKKVVPPIDEFEQEELAELDQDEEEEESEEEEGKNLDEAEKSAQETLEDKEEEELQLTDEQEAIKQAIVAQEPLPDEILETIVPQWWHKEPFSTTGFILEGFPRTVDEEKFLVERGLFPDAVILLTMQEIDMLGRLLPPRMEKWHKKHNLHLARKEKKKKKAKEKKEKAMNKRREELIKERDQARAERARDRAEEKGEESEYGSMDEEEVEEEEEEEDIEAILAEEFDEFEEEVEEEEEEESAMMEKFTDELIAAASENDQQLEMLQDALGEDHFNKVEIDSGRKPHIVRYLLNKNLKSFVEHRQAMFERATALNEKVANKMLATGYKFYSQLYRWCPVKLLEGDCLQPYYGLHHKPFPCLYRQNVYFLHSAAARDAFLQNPLTYVQKAKPLPNVPIRLAIIGPPKSGKTTVAHRFVEEYGVVRLSIGEAMRTLLDTQPRCHLATRMRDMLVKGLVVPEDMQVEALHTVLLDTQCQTRGYVLDGYPMTGQQAQQMAELNIVPDLVIYTEMGQDEILNRGHLMRTSPLRTLPLHDSEPILVIKTETYRSHVDQVLEFYDTQYQNVSTVDPVMNKWWVWNRTLELTRANIKQRQTFITRIRQGAAASIDGLGVTDKEFNQSLGSYGHFCPVSLANGQFVDGSTVKSNKYAAKFQGRYYKMAGESELNEFIAKPEQYVPPLAPNELPSRRWLPRRRFKKAHDKAVELRGYCPVTFLDGKLRYEAITDGDPELMVEYLNKIYCMESEEKLQKFMRMPEPYSKLVLPRKLPPRKDSVTVTGLPLLGFMEQSVSTALIAALTATGNFKPKYPHQSVTRSALLHTAYHLKAFNPKSSEFLRKKYKQKLEKFEETCGLIKYLGDNMTKRCQTVEEMTPEFHQKLKMFCFLKNIEPTSSWIM